MRGSAHVVAHLMRALPHQKHTQHTPSMKRHKNILPNSYVPAYARKVLTANLNRLSKNSILALCLLWPLMKSTQPPLPKDKPNRTQAHHNKLVRDEFKAMAAKKSNKARMIEAVLVQHWPHGLNLLQLAQVDCQLMVDNPNSYHWILSTAIDAWGNEAPLSIEPSSFLNKLAHQLSKLFMSYIYVCTHPLFPLIIIRVQVFDLIPNASKRSRLVQGSHNPHISSHRPYFLAVPLNSPHLIHSPSDDLVSQVVLQAVESSLSVNPARSIHLNTPNSQKSIRSLSSMQILKGSSRFSNSLAAWSPYADGAADVSPLATSEKHATMLSITQKPSTRATEADTTKAIANIRFKGSANGALISETPYDVLSSHKKQKPNPLSESGHVDPNSRHALARQPQSPYSSLVPIRYAEFVIQEPLEATDTNDSESTTTNVKLKIVGNDVFAGLHQLAVAETDPAKAVVNPKILPGWLTGEEGANCGKIKQGKFYRTS